jgi:GNAT superfamily N-acetyltransferase
MSGNIRIEFAKEEWIHRLCDIWSICFEESVVYAQGHFRRCDIGSQVLVLMEGEEPVSMLTMLPASTVIQGERRELTYLYAVATHPEYRKNGYSTRLLEYTKDWVHKQGRIAFLVPAEPSLIQFYQKRGFYPATSMKHAVIQAIPAAQRVVCSDVTASEYKEIRDRVFGGEGYVEWSLAEMEYRLTEAGRDGGYAKKLSWMNQTYGVIASVQQNVLFVKEAAMPDEVAEVCMRTLAWQLGCKEARANLPSYSRLAGTVTPFSMIGEPLPMEYGYLNLVMD